MDRIIETHTFGPHSVAVVEDVEDEGVGYLVLVDGQPVTEALPVPPTFEELVRIYARSEAEATPKHP